MSQVFGPMRQLGFVVPDIQEAMQLWVEQLGVGPFYYVDQFTLDGFEYDGSPQQPASLAMALANSGDVQIELIQPLDDTPSMFREFLSHRPDGGLQHWATWPSDYDARFREAVSRGMVVGQAGHTSRGRFVYFRDPLAPGTAVEMAEESPERVRVYGLVAAAAADWDGADPIRLGMP